MSTKIDFNIKKIPSYLKSAIVQFRKYAFISYLVLVIAVNGFLIFQINMLINKEASSDQIAEQQNIIKRPKIDQETIDKIERLEDQNIAVQSLFKSARDNPFRDN